MGTVCENCEKDLGRDTIKCGRRSQGTCPYTLKKVINTQHKGASIFFMIIGVLVIYATSVNVGPDTYSETSPVLLQLTVASLLILLGLFSIILGYFLLTAKRILIRHSYDGTVWEKETVGRFETKVKYYLDWRDVPLDYKFFKNTKATSIAAFVYQDAKNDLVSCMKKPDSDEHIDKLNKAAQNIFKYVVYSLIFNRQISLKGAKVYTSFGKNLNETHEENNYYLRIGGNPLVKGNLEKNLIGQFKPEKQDFFCNPYAISLQDLIRITCGKPKFAARNLSNSILTEVIDMGIYDSSNTLENIEEYYEHYDKVNKLIKKFESKNPLVTSAFNSDLEHAFGIQAKRERLTWLAPIFDNVNLKTIRIGIVVVAFLGIAVLRTYFPKKLATAVPEVLEQVQLEEEISGVINRGTVLSRLKKKAALLYYGTLDFFDDFIPFYEFDRPKQQAGEVYNKLKSKLQYALSVKNDEIKQKALKIIETSKMNLEFLEADLLKLVDHPSQTISTMAIKILSKNGLAPDKMPEKLESLLEDPNYPNRSVVAEALKTYEKFAIKELEEALE